MTQPIPTAHWSGATYPRFSVAPMMEWTTRHYRYFARLLSRHTLLYTEMVTTGALLHGRDPERFLAYHADEHPLALQLGGSVPEELAACARMAEAAGYDEVNLNVGCPSDRVQNNMIGACLMAYPDTVAACIAAMQAEVKIPVTVKCRIGIDDQDSEADLTHFIETVAAAGGQIFIIHARKAWLEGLSPKENRDIPPLDYDRVYRLKQAHPELTIALNGGLKQLPDMQAQLDHVNGIMVGREAYQNPGLLLSIDQAFFNDTAERPSRHEAIRQYRPYVAEELAQGTRLNALLKPLLGVFQGVPGARAFRRHLSENAHRAGAGLEVLDDALAKVPEFQLEPS